MSALKDIYKIIKIPRCNQLKDSGINFIYFNNLLKSQNKNLIIKEIKINKKFYYDIFECNENDRRFNNLKTFCISMKYELDIFKNNVCHIWSNIIIINNLVISMYNPLAINKK